MSFILKPRASTDAFISGTVSSNPVLMRMCPSGVATR
jgi:hypothetical protein